MRSLLRLFAVAVSLSPALAPSLAHAGDDAACTSAIAVAERKLDVPSRVLGTIATVESGRQIGAQRVPWPWSINAQGVGHFYASKEEAITAVQTLRSAGVHSIDVGCMQINLVAHPQAFESLEDAFDPAINAEYGARFIKTLVQQTGRLASAMTSYHSQTPVFAAEYARRLLAVWPQAAAFGLRAEDVGPASGGHALKPPGRRGGGGGTDGDSRSLIEIISIHGSGWPTAPRRLATNVRW